MNQSATIDEIVRRSAARLADIDARLPSQVEQVLAEDPLPRPADRIIDPISLAALVVSIVSSSWTIYHDIKKDRATEALDQAGKIRRLTEQLQEAGPELGLVPSHVTPEQRAQIIMVIATEMVGFDTI
jgi:hypothetical protein